MNLDTDQKLRFCVSQSLKKLHKFVEEGNLIIDWQAMDTIVRDIERDFDIHPKSQNEMGCHVRVS